MRLPTLLPVPESKPQFVETPIRIVIPPIAVDHEDNEPCTDEGAGK